MSAGGGDVYATLRVFSEAVGGVEGLRELEAQERARLAAVEAQGQREARAWGRAMEKGARRCNARTKAGHRCTRPAVVGARRCHQHKKAPKFRRTDCERAQLAEDCRKSPSRARRSLLGL